MLDGLLTLGILENGLRIADFQCCEDVLLDAFSGTFKVEGKHDGNVYMTEKPKRIRNKAIFRDDNASLSQGQDKRWYFYFSLDEDQLEQLPEKLIAACNTPENIQNWNDFRSTGEDRYKHALVQVNYNGQVPDGGLLKGIKTVSPFFFYDIDCRDREECRRIINQLLQMKEELGLVEVAESASFGVHAVASYKNRDGHEQ